MKPTIIDVDPASGTVPVLVQFFQGGQFVQLANTTTLTCNGVALTWNGLAQAARVPTVHAGGTLSFVYTRASVSTTVNVTVPARPVVTTPASGALLSHSAPVTIHYVAAASAGVNATVSDGATAVGGTEQPDNGNFTADATGLQPGPGTVSVVRRFVITPGGTGFASVTATYSISSVSTHVTWQ